MTTGTTITRPAGATERRDGWRIAAAVVGTLLGVASILAIIGTMLYVGHSEPSVPGRRSDEERAALLARHQAEDQQELSTYGWVDRGQGVVRIPISVAMDKVVEKYAAGSTRPSTAP
jgi:hypothetical protein